MSRGRTAYDGKRVGQISVAFDIEIVEDKP